MPKSFAMQGESPRIPHLAKEGSELFDLRDDVDDSFERVETPAAKVVVTAAELRALAATPKELVPAAGAGTVLQYLGSSVRLKSGTEVLAENVGGSNLGVKYTGAAGVQVSEDMEMTGFITEAANASMQNRPAADAIVVGDAAVNAPLVLHNVGAGEITGNASDDALLEVTVRYRLHKAVAL